MESYRSLIAGDMPPWVRRFVKGAGRVINRYDMIRDGETVLLGVSGGKDSLALALALSLRRKWLPIDYNLKALMIDWKEHPVDTAMREPLQRFFSDLDIDFEITEEPQFPASFDGEFNCYLCSRNRRRILFDYAAQRNIRLIAMGHHLDDLVETSMINLFFRGSFDTMQPVQEFFDGKIYVIRPLIETHERVTQRLCELYDLPRVKPVCPYDQTNIRSKVKPIVKELTMIDKLAREHVYEAHNLTGNIKR